MCAHSQPVVGFKDVVLVPLRYPLFFVLVLWAIQLAGDEFGWALSSFGVKPRDLNGLLGIFTMPFVHGSYEHLSNNSMPLLVLGWALFKFYPTIAWRSILGIWLIGGLWLWISGRDAYHIGASGVVYGLATFLFLSGWIRKEKGVAALSLVIVFVYGGLWWGILPVDPQMSWEGHLWGALAGIAMAWHLRKKGPQRPLYQWEIDELEEEKRAALREACMDTLVYEEVLPDAEGGPLSTKDESPHSENSRKSGDSMQNSPNVQYTFRPRNTKGNSDLKG